MAKAPLCIDDALKTVEDFGHDLSSAPEYGFTLGQDDCWDCARAIQVVLREYRRTDDVVAGVNKQLTEQFELSTKYFARNDELHGIIAQQERQAGEQIAELLETLKQLRDAFVVCRNDIAVDDWIDTANFAIARAEGRA